MFPFILRGITLAGIDSNMATVQDRLIAWERLQQLISEQVADQLLMATVSLEDIASVCSAKIAGKAPGRFLVSTAREM